MRAPSRPTYWRPDRRVPLARGRSRLGAKRRRRARGELDERGVDDHPSAPTPARLSTADAAALKADPNCQPAAVACAWSQCYPLNSKWTSYSSCLADSCQMKERACVMDLIQDLYDPIRERSRGVR